MASYSRWKHLYNHYHKKVVVKWSRYRPGVPQKVGRGIALFFHDRGTRRVSSSTPRLHFTPRKGPVPILQEAGWASGLVWTGGKSRPHRDSIPDRPAHGQSLYQLSHPVHIITTMKTSNLRQINHIKLVITKSKKLINKLQSLFFYSAMNTDLMGRTAQQYLSTFVNTL